MEEEDAAETGSISDSGEEFVSSKSESSLLDLSSLLHQLPLK